MQIPKPHYETKNTQNDHIIAHFDYFFTCHNSKTIFLTEILKEIKVTLSEKSLTLIKQKLSHFEEGLVSAERKNSFLSH